MISIDHLALQMPDPAAAADFYASAFGLGSRIQTRASTEPTTGYRGFDISLVVAQPSIVDSLFSTAIAGGATAIKPPAKSFWGYGATLRDPYGTIWKLASESKKNTGPESRKVDHVVLSLGVDDVAVTKQFYLDRGLPLTKSFGRKYVEFGTENIKLALYSRRFAAKQAGISPEGSGSRRMAVSSNAGAFTDPDGFVWQPTSAAHRQPNELVSQA